MSCKINGALVAVILVFCGCGNDPSGPTAGDGAHTGNALAHGHIYNPDSTPAQGANVRFVPVGYNPRMAGAVKIDSTLTDQNGYYSMLDLAAGSYNVLATGTRGSAFRGSVGIADTTEVGSDTLRAPGNIRGVVKLVPPVDSAMVFVILLGTNNYTMADTNGAFVLNGLGRGSYRALVLSTAADYGSKDTVWEVRPGETAVLGDTVELTWHGIPRVAGLVLSYDTMKQVVTLFWNTDNTGRVKGYNVYRQHVDSAEVKLSVQSLTDTYYVDSTVIQDQSYIYSVVAVDVENKEGVASSGDTIVVVPAFQVSDTLFQINEPAWILAAVIDPRGNIVVLNGTAYTPTPVWLERYSPSGQLINSWEIVDGIEETHTYDCLRIDDSGHILVLTKNNLLIRYDTAGNEVSGFQYHGAGYGLGIFGDTIFIADRGGMTVTAFKNNGDSLFSWGDSGSGPGQFISNIVLGTNEAGEVFVGDQTYENRTYKNRVQIFNCNGSYQTSFFFKGKGLLGATLEVYDDTLLICGSALLAYSKDGDLIFKNYVKLMQKKLFFDRSSNDLLLITCLGEVIRLRRR